MDTNDLTNPHKDSVKDTFNKATPEFYTLNVDKASKQIDAGSAELSEFNYLLAHYKAKVLERYASLYKF